jgi:hypothetical protein
MPHRYHHLDDLPAVIPIFPLSGAILLPRATLPLNIFEPRYIAMTDAAMEGDRVIGMIQPNAPQDRSRKPALFGAGCAGRITSYSETDDGRYMITLAGICRFQMAAEPGRELDATTPYRQAAPDYAPFADDLDAALDDKGIDRPRLLEALKKYLNLQSLEADWTAIQKAPGETLVNSLCMICPFSPEEKQALLEARGIVDRCTALTALIEMAALEPPTGSTSVQ